MQIYEREGHLLQEGVETETFGCTFIRSNEGIFTFLISHHLRQCTPSCTLYPETLPHPENTLGGRQRSRRRKIFVGKPAVDKNWGRTEVLFENFFLLV